MQMEREDWRARSPIDSLLRWRSSSIFKVMEEESFAKASSQRSTLVLDRVASAMAVENESTNVRA